MIVPREIQTHAAVADHYDDLDAIYRGLWGLDVHHGYWRTGRETPDEAVAALSELVGEELAIRHGARLVDIGCGYGGTARRFAGRGAGVIGLSLSREQISHAPPASGVELRCADWLANGLPAASFDGAYAIESSEHMADKPGFFREARRVLRPDGRLVICAWLASDEPTRWQVRHLLEPICREGRLPSMLTAGEYRDMATSAGFRCVNYRDISQSVARTWSICFRRFLRAMAFDSTMRRRILTARNRIFALSVPRLILAYHTGAMRYGVFTLAKIS
jgi:tocopherol O-methyltransferase